MEMKTTARVMGMKYFNDTVDGTKYDTTKVYVEMRLDDSNGRAKGFAVSEMQWGTSDNFAKVKHLPFPFDAELTVELVTSGKVQKQIIRDVKPLQVAK